MYDLGDQFKFDLNKAIANPECIIKGEKYRFTILSESLIRLEYSANGVFNDLPTMNVLYRNFKKPSFEVEETDKQLFISTKYFNLIYLKEKSFYGGKINPASNLRVTCVNNKKVWNYGFQEFRNYAVPIYKSNDDKNKIVKSLFSLDGFVTLDDSKTDYFDENGCLVKNDANNIDIYLFVYGNKFFTCLHDYYNITGMPSLLPRYAFGNWWSRNIAYNEEDINKLIDEFKEHSIPLSVILLNDAWSKKTEHGRSSFTFNDDLFKEPNNMIEVVHNSNIKLGLTINPMNGFSKEEKYYDYLKKYLTPDEKGIIPFNIVDNRSIDAYMKIIIHPLDIMGIDFYNIDYYDSNNLNKLMLLKHYNMLDMGRNRRPLVYGYNANIVSHRYGIHYFGKSTVTWDSISEIAKINCDSANLGVSYISHDIGGFYKGIEDAELYTRFIQLGVFCPILKLNSDYGKYYKRCPWQWGIKTYEIAKDYLNLRHRLIPYLYSENYRYHKLGVPFIQPLYYQYPKVYDDELYSREYYFGSQFFISPIVKHKDYIMNRTIHHFFIPDGIWYDFVTGKKFPGNRKYVSFFRDEDYPVFVKCGAIIPMSLDTQDNNIGIPSNLEIQIFPGKNNIYNLYEDDGISNDYKNGKYLITNIEYNYLPNNYTVIIRPVDGNSGIVPDKRNYKIVFRNTKKSDSVITYVNNTKIENDTYVSKNDFVVEIKDVPTLEQLTINCKGKDIEIDALRIINEDIEGILSYLPIQTEVKDLLDEILFNPDTTIKQKRLQIRKINNKKLERKYVELFLKLLDYISQV